MASNLCYLACRDLDDFQSSQELLQFNLFQDLQGFQSDLRKRWYLDPDSGLYLKTLRLNEYTYADLLQDMHTYLNYNLNLRIWTPCWLVLICLKKHVDCKQWHYYRWFFKKNCAKDINPDSPESGYPFRVQCWHFLISRPSVIIKYKLSAKLYTLGGGQNDDFYEEYLVLPLSSLAVVFIA